MLINNSSQNIFQTFTFSSCIQSYQTHVCCQCEQRFIWVNMKSFMTYGQHIKGLLWIGKGL